MRKSPWVALMAIASLSGCGQAESAFGSGDRNPGRYAGIGTYDVGRLWAEMAGIEAPSDPAAARLADDEHVIVVIDSHTGEVRQCGDYSGVCVTMNPWTDHGSRPAAPVKLGKHAADLATEDEAAAEAPPAANDQAAPAR